MAIKIIYEPTYVESGWFDVTVKTPGWWDDDLTDVGGQCSRTDVGANMLTFGS